MFAAFNFVCLITGKESSSTFLSRCGVKCRWRAGSDFPLRKESNKPSYMSSGGTSWSNREINKSLVCFILFIFFIFFNHMAKIVVHRGEQRRKLTKKKKEMLKKTITLWPSFAEGMLDNSQNFPVWLRLVCAFALLGCEPHPGVNLRSKPVRLLSGSSRLPQLNTPHTAHSHCLFITTSCHTARASAIQTPLRLCQSCPPSELHTSSELHNRKRAIVLVEFPL